MMNVAGLKIFKTFFINPFSESYVFKKKNNAHAGF